MLRATGFVIGTSGVTQVLGTGGAVSVPADVTEDVLATITVPAGVMGANGALRITTFWTFTNNANNKTMNVRFSGAGGTIFGSVSLTSQVTTWMQTYIVNTAAAVQVGQNVENHAGSGPQQTFGTAGAVNTANATTVVITGQKAVAGDTLTLNSYLVELIKP